MRKIMKCVFRWLTKGRSVERKRSVEDPSYDNATLLHGGAIIARLKYLGMCYNPQLWMEFKVEHTELSMGILESSLKGDYEDLGWEFFDGEHSKPLSDFLISFDATRNVISLKYVPSPDYNDPVVNAQLKDETRELIERLAIEGLSDEDDVGMPLYDIAHACVPNQADEVADILLRSARTRSGMLRRSAVYGLSLLIQKSRLLKTPEIISLLEAACASEFPGIRASASKSLARLMRLQNK
jgi:hypothetical protein